MIEKIFQEIINEACEGIVKLEYPFNILFDTNLEGKIITSENEYEGTIKPCLNITNWNEFLTLLEEYTYKALIFYKDDTLISEINDDNIKIKTIMALLFSNASIEDFNNPLAFLKKRINFFQHEVFGYNLEFPVDVFKGKLNISFKRDSVLNETPYALKIFLENEEHEKYFFPDITLGVSENEAYIYSIQKKKDNEGKYSKKIDRILYKVNEGFNFNEDNYELYEEGNLKDVTHSFVLSANILIDILNLYGIKNINLQSFLLTRWNGKRIAYQRKLKHYEETNGNPQVINTILNDIENQDELQSRLTEKFIRTFLRLSHHKKGLKITSYPDETFDTLRMQLESNTNNNSLMNDVDTVIKR